MLDDQLILCDRAGWQEVIEGRLDCDNAAAQWLDIVNDGVCLRPRALLTTMYLRLLVGDLFVHGIGGGKYDQLTDGILGEFFGIEPPPLAVATATLQLPIGRPGIDNSESLHLRIQSLKRQLWNLRYHADQRADELGPEAQQLSEEKLKLLRAIPERGEKWDWHQRITRINQRLSDLAESRIAQVQTELAQLTSQLRQSQLIESREYSFCLYPRAETIELLKRLCGV
jgi:hypothetical protein